MLPDDDQCYRAAQAKDARFDGWFFVGVTSTGIYCRPSCPGDHAQARRTSASTRRPPRPSAAGFRACKRCRPDASPGSPEWNMRADLVGRAMRLIADGVVDRDGVRGLASRLGYSERHLNRQLVAEVGAGPLALARAQRAPDRPHPDRDDGAAVHRGRVRRRLRQHPPVQRHRPRGVRVDAYRAAPAQHDRDGAERARRSARPAPRLPRAVRRSRRCSTSSATRAGRRASRRSTARPTAASLALPHGHGVVVALRARRPVTCAATLRLADLRDLTTAVQRGRAGCSTSTPTRSRVDDALGADPLLGAARAPSARAPRSRRRRRRRARRARRARPAGLGGGRPHARRPGSSRDYGKPLSVADERITHVFPDAATLAERRSDVASRCRARGAGRSSPLCSALASGAVVLDAGADRDEAAAALARAAGHRSVDGRLPGDAGARRPRRVPADRPRRAPRPRTRSVCPPTRGAQRPWPSGGARGGRMH